MRYLVTGGCGFIGSHLCDRLLAEGHEVRVLDDLSSGKREQLDSRAHLVVDSIAREAVFDPLLADVDGVFHLAAIASVERSRTQWELTHAVNLGGMVRLLAATGRLPRPIPVVYASSAAVYGDNPHLPLDESIPPSPLTAYGADKLGCELHARVGALVHGIPTVGLRFFNVYGTRQDPSSPYSGVVSIFMRRIPAGEPVTLYGDGKQTRDFIHVSDVVSALAISMQTLHKGAVRSEMVNVCTGQEVSLLTLMETIATLSGKAAQVIPAEARSGDIRHSCGNAKKLRTVLGVVPQMALADGLKNMLGTVS